MNLNNLQRANEIAKELKEITEQVERLEYLTSIDFYCQPLEYKNSIIAVALKSDSKIAKDFRNQLRELLKSRITELENEAKEL